MPSSSITGIPPAGALKVWRLTFSLQLPWFPKGLFPFRTHFFLLSGQPQKHAILVPMMIRVTANPKGHSHYSHFGTDPWAVSLSETSVHCKQVITTNINNFKECQIFLALYHLQVRTTFSLLFK